MPFLYDLQAVIFHFSIRLSMEDFPIPFTEVETPNSITCNRYIKTWANKKTDFHIILTHSECLSVLHAKIILTLFQVTTEIKQADQPTNQHMMLLINVNRMDCLPSVINTLMSVFMFFSKTNPHCITVKQKDKTIATIIIF